MVFACESWFRGKLLAMADKEQININEGIDEGMVESGIEPGASNDSMLVTEDSFQEYEREFSGTIDNRQMKKSSASTISEYQESAEDEASSSSSSRTNIVDVDHRQVLQDLNEGMVLQKFA